MTSTNTRRWLAAVALVAIVCMGASGCTDADLEGNVYVYACEGDGDCTNGKLCHPSFRVCVNPGEFTGESDIDGPFSDAEPDGAADSGADSTAQDGAGEDGGGSEDSGGDAGPDGADPDGADPDGAGDADDTTDDIDDATEPDTSDTMDVDAGEPDVDPDVPDTGNTPSCPASMVKVPTSLGDRCVDKYEAARSDATSTDAGDQNQSPAKSVAGVLPWTSVTATAAAAACDKAGKRLCSLEELKSACGGYPTPTAYPYGSTYQPGGCNGYASGFGKALPTGSIATCKSPAGVFDASGNVQEWTETKLDDNSICAFGGDYTQGQFTPTENRAQEACDPQLVTEGLVCWSFANPSVSFANLGFRCCKDPE